MTIISQEISSNLRLKIEDKISKIKVKYFDINKTGYILNLIFSDIEIINLTIQKTLSQFFTIIATLFGTFIMMCYINIYMALICLFIIPLLFLLINPLILKSKHYYKKQQMTTDNFNNIIEEYLSGYLVIKSFKLDYIYNDIFNKINTHLYKQSQKASFYSNIILPLLFFINTVNYALYCIVGGFFVLKNMLNIGDVHVCTTYSRHFSYPLLQISGIIGTLQSTIASFDRIFNFLKLEEEEDNTKNNYAIFNPKGKISFENVTFGYNKYKNIIENLNFTINPGEIVALVGPTGSGKTTIINLLLQFYDIKHGSISIDGINIKNLNIKYFRKLFGIVLQENLLFHGTIKENIVYNNNNISNNILEEIVAKVGLEKYINSLPLKYNTIINENSSNISYGQKQLIAIARALILNRPILLLDEATSNIDTVTEEKIQKSIKELIKNKTALIVAHRISTIQNADLILVLNNGKVIEKGKHEELIRKKGYYYKLYNHL